MSKKTRKKSSKPAAATIPSKPARATSRSSSVPVAKSLKAKPPKPSAAKSAKPAAAKRAAPAAKKAVATRVKSPAAKPMPAPAKPKAAAPPKAPSPLSEGMKAPAFVLPRDGGETISLGDYAGSKLVLFFYPRADTPGCTREAIDFTRLLPDFARAGTAVVGVSADPLKAQNNFRDRHDLGTPLLSDETHAMLQAYGAWGEKSMYGKVFEGVLRTTMLIGGDGEILKIWRGVKVDGHADEVLATARDL